MTNKMKGFNPQHIFYNFLFTFSESLSHSTTQYTSLLQFLSCIDGLPWENTMGYRESWACKSPIVNQVMAIKLQHFIRHFFQKIHYEDTSHEPSLGETAKIVIAYNRPH